MKKKNEPTTPEQYLETYLRWEGKMTPIMKEIVSKAYKAGYNQGLRNGTDDGMLTGVRVAQNIMLNISILMLHRHFKFGEQRMRKFIKHVEKEAVGIIDSDDIVAKVA